MTRLCLVRHGETDWNAGKRIQGQIDIPLSTLGHAQARATGNALQNEGFAAIYTSDLTRARQTAEATAHLAKIPLQLDQGFRERHYGVFQGLTYTECEARYPAAYACHKSRDPRFAPLGKEEFAEVVIEVSVLGKPEPIRFSDEQDALAQLDQVFVRGMVPMGLQVPRGRIWWRMSDHLPLVAEFELPDGPGG